LTPDEFRAWVDRRSSADTCGKRIREVANSFGWGERRVRSWYYAERPVPLHIAVALHPQVTSTFGRALRVVTSEMDRLDDLTRAIREMCRQCEEGGECHIPDCPLRAVSPMPLRRNKA